MPIFVVLLLICLIVLIEWKQLKNTKLADRITFVVLLSLAAIMGFLPLENLPGPITFLQSIFSV